mmetsp:Transcript_25693/g.53653  ORF Transcript_25693/g.53653 Transcript_25693/m.53653 type:complete len:96 (+) Transcript_25693:1616-1903(+)
MLCEPARNAPFWQTSLASGWSAMVNLSIFAGKSVPSPTVPKSPPDGGSDSVSIPAGANRKSETIRFCPVIILVNPAENPPPLAPPNPIEVSMFTP